MTRVMQQKGLDPLSKRRHQRLPCLHSKLSSPNTAVSNKNLGVWFCPLIIFHDLSALLSDLPNPDCSSRISWQAEPPSSQSFSDLAHSHSIIKKNFINEPACVLEERREKLRSWNLCRTKDLYLGLSFSLSTLVEERKTKQLWCRQEENKADEFSKLCAFPFSVYSSAYIRVFYLLLLVGGKGHIKLFFDTLISIFMEHIYFQNFWKSKRIIWKKGGIYMQ